MNRNYRPDITVENDGDTVAVVEVKARSDTTSDWAEQIIAGSMFPHPRKDIASVT